MHFTFDLWTSPNHHAFLGVVGHWVDNGGTLHSTVLGLQRFRGRHTGENQAIHFWEVATRYKLVDKIGYFTLDNATNNDSALRFIKNYLGEIGILFDPVSRRLRCFGHVLNLVVKAFLWGEDAETFEAEIITRQDLDREVEKLQAWRRKGPLGKLHNIITWICRTPQRWDRFEEKVRQNQEVGAVKALSLIHGNDTRWGGDYDSITRAFDLRESIEEFVSAAIRLNEDGERDTSLPHALLHDELMSEDWDILGDIMDILQPFRKWQLMLQGHQHYGQPHDILPAMDKLLTYLEDSRQGFEISERRNATKHIRTSLNTAWSLLNKYLKSIHTKYFNI